MTERSTGKTVYIDANIFIYFVEGQNDIASRVAMLFGFLSERPGLGVTSELTLAEVLVKARSPHHRRQFLSLIIWSGVFSLVPVTRDLLMETAEFRRSAGWARPDGTEAMPKLPDAIHVVSAIRAGCRFIVTDDGRMRLPASLRHIATSADDIATLTKALA